MSESSDSNKPIINETKKILKELGYDVKTSHLYEVFAKLSGYKSWNVAKTKDASFEKIIRDLESKSKNEQPSILDLVNQLDANVAPELLQVIYQLLGREVETLIPEQSMGVSFILDDKIAYMVRMDQVTEKDVRDLEFFMGYKGYSQGLIFTNGSVKTPLNIKLLDKDQLVMIATDYEKRQSMPRLVKKQVMELIESGNFKDGYYLGTNEKDMKPKFVNFDQDPNFLAAGSLGSGKSSAIATSNLMWMIGNMGHTLMFFVDLLKGANAHAAFFDLDQAKRVTGVESLKSLIGSLYIEAQLRRESFNEIRATSLKDYNKIAEKKLSNIIVVLEEFNTIPVAINFDKEYSIEGSIANQYFTLMRIGRSLGIHFVASAQKVTATDVPSELLPNFYSRQAFKMSKGESTYLIGDFIKDLLPSEKGRGINEGGQIMHFPHFSQEEQSDILNKYKKPLVTTQLYLTNEFMKKSIQ